MALSPTEEAQLRQLLAEQAELLNLAANESTIISKLGAQKKNLGQLTAASSVSDSDLLFVRQGTSDKSSVLSLLKGYFLPQATETVRGGAEIATQAEVNAGTDDATIITPKKMRLGFSISLASNGYISFPTWMGGLIIQWGMTSAIAAGSAVTIALPIAFPSEVLLTLVSPLNAASSTVSYMMAIGSIRTTTQISIVNRSSTISGVGNWFAIGY
jgi:hypothetical protein